MPTILDKIVRTKRKELADAKRNVPLEQVRSAARDAALPRDFHGAMDAPAPHGVHLIAELKRRSPSAGMIRPDFDPVAVARLYAEAGASALSVLTDRTYFDGRIEHVAQIKQAVPLPVLRKDFTLDEYQVYESRACGADAVLLITEVLGVEAVARLADLAGELGLTALIEVHRPDLLTDLVRAVDFDPRNRRLLGINNRDLALQKTDPGTTGRLAAMLDDKPLLVSESGIAGREDVEQVTAAGADAILVGETLLRADDVAGKVRQLLGIEP